jgi:hypothetical protein
MEKPKSLDSLFTEKLLRIPDYQRGYAWQNEQLVDFWEDLVNLSGERSHYTGVLTLKDNKIPETAIQNNDREHWLVKDHSYKVLNVVDGQQRLTTFVVFLQAFVECLRGLPGNNELPDSKIFVNDSLTIADITDRYLYKMHPRGLYRTYKFSYTADNPSDAYLRSGIFGEEVIGEVTETIYTLNLANAKRYFLEQLHNLNNTQRPGALAEIYKKITQRFLLNEHVITDDFDVFVTFETMNNRGKKLSDLELLKNRLIYLTTLFDDQQLDPASRATLRENVNNAWKEVYRQLGRNQNLKLVDDDFLRAHWVMYYMYSRNTGRDYIRFLLDERFTPKRFHTELVREVNLVAAEDQRSDMEVADELVEDVQLQLNLPVLGLEPVEINDYVQSLSNSASFWFYSFNPHMSPHMSVDERLWIERLNRLGMAYFRPLVMAILKNEPDQTIRIEAFKRIERFIFIAFKLTSARSNYRSSEFYNAARWLDKREKNLNEILEKLEDALKYAFDDHTKLRAEDFHSLLFRKFKDSAGFYGWSGIRYFLYEYEQHLHQQNQRGGIMDWKDLLKNERDKISIEHIYPQTETEDWALLFEGVTPEGRRNLNGSLGNLLVLSSSINSALQNDSFENKRIQRRDPITNDLIRNGYADGSHSEFEVSLEMSWGPKQIKERGLRLLTFMETRWQFNFRDVDRERLLFLPEFDIPQLP